MSMLQLTNDENKLLKELLEENIGRVKKVGGDPYFTADLVNIYRKLTAKPTYSYPHADPTSPGNLKVLHGAPQDDLQHEYAQAPTLKKTAKKIQKVTTTVPTLENIDQLSDVLTPEDPRDDVIPE